MAYLLRRPETQARGEETEIMQNCAREENCTYCPNSQAVENDPSFDKTAMFQSYFFITSYFWFKFSLFSKD